MASNENTPESVLNAPKQKPIQFPAYGPYTQIIRNTPRRGKKVKRHAKKEN